VSSGTLVLNYTYTDDAGTAKTGPAVSIAYAATPPPHLYVAQLNGPLLSCALNNDGTLASCASTGNGFTAPTGIAFYGANFAYVADYTSSTVLLCSVAADGTLSLCSSTGSNFQMPWQLAVQGTTLYASNASVTGGVTTCTIGADATLSGCTQSSGAGTAGIAANATWAYLGVGPATVNVCAVGAAGALSGCVATGSGFSALDGISLSNGYAYIANEGGASVSVCPINSTDGTLSACTASSVGGNPTDVAFDGTRAYVGDFASGHMNFCAVGGNGALGGCAISDGGTTFNPPMNQLAIH
jgi:6-phosphogluconolactonase (cycloisomerase 2 family)